MMSGISKKQVNLISYPITHQAHL